MTTERFLVTVEPHDPRRTARELRTMIRPTEAEMVGAAEWINKTEFVLERWDRTADNTFSPRARERNDYCAEPKTYARWRVRFANETIGENYWNTDTGWHKTRKAAIAAVPEWIEAIYSETIGAISEGLTLEAS